MKLSRGPRLLLVGLAVVVVVAAGGIGYVSYLLAGEAGPGDPVTVEVSKGQTAAQVGEELDRRGVIRSALVFRLVARSRGLDQRLVAGTYELETGMSVDEAIAALEAGPTPPETLRVTVEEGLTVAQTLERLAAQTPHDVADFRRVLQARDLELPGWVPALDSFGPDVRQPYEGLLFPETYRFLADATAREILQRMVDQLEGVMAGILGGEDQAAAAADLDRYQTLILASLVEREAQTPEDRPRVSAVLRNRLARDMLLQVDATVLYALGEHKDRVLNQDLQVASPYNTYRPPPGLPPTPIAAPGEASLRAAFAPADVRYLYYVLRCGEQGHAFARTLEEHNSNVAEFRRCPDRSS